jgi:[ribosomal protein S18]-alanine N-acetyltransferase
MTGDPVWLADIHAACFTIPRPWSADEFAQLLAAPSSVLACADHGFALGRVAADEAELVTIAVVPHERRKGVARRLLDDLEGRLKNAGAARVFLEVSSENSAAIALYRAAGYDRTGRRNGYYRAPDGQTIDGLILSKPLA